MSVVDKGCLWKGRKRGYDSSQLKSPMVRKSGYERRGRFHKELGLVLTRTSPRRYTNCIDSPKLGRVLTRDKTSPNSLWNPPQWTEVTYGIKEEWVRIQSTKVTKGKEEGVWAQWTEVTYGIKEEWVRVQSTKVTNGKEEGVWVQLTKATYG